MTNLQNGNITKTKEKEIIEKLRKTRPINANFNVNFENAAQAFKVNIIYIYISISIYLSIYI